MFTFLTLSYNQEKYIIQHLESIKDQIIRHAPKEQVSFILADDHSEDRTVGWAKLWLEKNKKFFSDITILENNENKGVVNNYLKGINTIKAGSKIKCLAADDLYYTRSVFNVLKGYDVVLTPTICFDDAHDVIQNRYYVYKSCSGLKGEKLSEKIRNGLDFENKIQAPGAFINLGLLQDQGLQRFLRQYVWIEDYPQWYYIFNQYDKDINADINLKPYVLYRITSGISLNKNHSKRDVFQKEEEKIMEIIRIEREKKKKYRFAYGYFLDMCKIEYLDSYVKPSLRRFRRQMREESENVRSYLQRLEEKDKAFRLKYA